MTSLQKVVFLFDVDNTLLDNDRVLDDLRKHLVHEFGFEARDRYFAILEELYVELGYADYLGALQRYRFEHLCDPRLLIERLSISAIWSITIYPHCSGLPKIDSPFSRETSMKPVNPHILTVNGSSSSIKFALYQIGEPLMRGLYGKVDRIGLKKTNLIFHGPISNL